MASSSRASGRSGARARQRPASGHRRPPARPPVRRSAPVAVAPPPPELPPARRPPLLGVLLAVPVVLVLVGVVLAATGVLAGGLVLVALGVLVVLADAYFGAPDRLGARLGGRSVDPEHDARLLNLVDGLCVAAGVPAPELRILEDGAVNALVLAGRGGATLYCTRGLLERLDRMELEAVLAHELSHLKRTDAARAGVASMACGALLAWLPASARLVAYLSGDEREALADAAGVRLTRYPPALAAAIETIAASPSRPAGLDAVTLRATAGWWFAPLAEAEPTKTVAGRLDLGLRSAALGEL